MPTSPTHSAAAHWWIGACLGANLLLELLDYARADVKALADRVSAKSCRRAGDRRRLRQFVTLEALADS